MLSQDVTKTDMLTSVHHEITVPITHTRRNFVHILYFKSPHRRTWYRQTPR